MSFTDTVKEVLATSNEPLSPQAIRQIIKEKYPEFYATESHQRNVEKGYYKDLEHALLAQIYSLVRTSESFFCDKSQKPMKVSLVEPSSFSDEPIGEDFESDIGTVYVLSTETFTKEGREIYKIGFTTQNIESRINQLYTTGVPFKFRLYKKYETKNFVELEQALHRLLTPFKLNKSREFFTDQAIPYIEKIVEIHRTITKQA